jgi:hypothetical protein
MTNICPGFRMTDLNNRIVSLINTPNNIYLPWIPILYCTTTFFDLENIPEPPGRYVESQIFFGCFFTSVLVLDVPFYVISIHKYFEDNSHTIALRQNVAPLLGIRPLDATNIFHNHPLWIPSGITVYYGVPFFTCVLRCVLQYV